MTPWNSQFETTVEDANMNLREDSSAPIKIDEDRGHATTVPNSVLASLGSDSEHGDHFHERAKRYTPSGTVSYPRANA